VGKHEPHALLLSAIRAAGQAGDRQSDPPINSDY
jgi:hypothetical protein